MLPKTKAAVDWPALRPLDSRVRVRVRV